MDYSIIITVFQLCGKYLLSRKIFLFLGEKIRRISIYVDNNNNIYHIVIMNTFNSFISIMNLPGVTTPPLPPLLSPITDGLVNYLDFSSNATVTISSGSNISSWKNLIDGTTNNAAANCRYGAIATNGVNIGESTSKPGYLYLTNFPSAIGDETLFYVISIDTAPLSITHGIYLANCYGQDVTGGVGNTRLFVLTNTQLGTNTYRLVSGVNNGSNQYSSTFSIVYGQKYLITITKSSNSSCNSSRLNGVSINTSFNLPLTVINTLPVYGYIGVKNGAQRATQNIYHPYTLYEFENYNVNLSLSDIQRTEQYLKNKWAIY